VIPGFDFNHFSGFEFIGVIDIFDAVCFLIIGIYLFFGLWNLVVICFLAFGI